MEDFFKTYLNALLQTITGADPQACHAAWRTYLHIDFVCIGPLGHVLRGDDCVIPEWRTCWTLGHYSSPWLSDLRLEHDAAGLNHQCHAKMIRCYRGKGCDVAREVLQLQVLAVQDANGQSRVTRHCYQPHPPREVRGHVARSQINQDLWVLYRFGDLAGGFFLEIGANHSEELSNTSLLEKAANWKGICVEPFPQGDWSHRRAELVRVAIGPDGNKLRFIAPGHVLGGLVDSVDLPRVLRDVPQDQQAILEVETMSISSILQRACGGATPKLIHYCSLDTEGSEYDILCGFPFETTTLLSITVEHNYIEPRRTQIRELLEKRGFLLDVSVEHDDFYVLNGFQKYL